jgi:transcriptional regulator with XRE-family HTH domain
MSKAIGGLPMLAAWRDAQSLSLEALAARAGLHPTRLAAIEAGEQDFTGAELSALAEALGCAPWHLLEGLPHDGVNDSVFDNSLLAQMIRDICVEAVTTYDDMGRLDELKVSGEADAFWRSVAALLHGELRSILQTRRPVAVSVLAETATKAF